MPSLTSPLIVSDLIQRAHEMRESEDGWEPFREGVTAQWLYEEEGEGARAVLLRYEPGARVAVHEHVGYEHLLILDGDQYDEDGSYPTGTFVVHPPGTRHSPGSRTGCVALLIYEKAVRFV
jgi:anti-sigma factor ChrR (cupin superfamily)